MLTAIYIIYIKKNKEDNKYYYIPFISFTIFIFINSDIKLLPFISGALIVLLLYLLYNEKDNTYLIMSLVHSLALIFANNLNTYLALLILLICFITYYLVDYKRKDLYQGTIYFLLTLFVRQLLKDLNLDSYTVLNTGIFVLFVIALTRTIIIKHSPDYKSVEYISLVILYAFAITTYKTELNGMLLYYYY